MTSSRARRVKAARAVAIAADLLQIALFPLFGPGVVAPWNDALDVLTGVVLLWLLGWHWSLLPTFVAELVPGLDLVPTWTGAVFLATRRDLATPAHLPAPAPETKPS
jgi:hypothetical protein